MEENTAITTCVALVCAFLAFLTFSLWQGSMVDKQNQTQRMVACVEAGKDWVYVDDANTFQCIGGRN